MKAAQINKYGHSDVIEIVDIEKPKAGPGQVLVKIYASSINPFDFKLREGYMKEMMPLNFPFTLGGDVAGVVTEIGQGVDKFQVGNKVYGSANALAGGSGAFAEFASVPSEMVAKMPKNLDFNQAAAVVLVGVSAVQAFLEHIKLQPFRSEYPSGSERPGQKILIHGGAGGIGTIAIQIAKSKGAYVATTTTGDGFDYAKKLGADQVIDYKNQKFEEILSDYDAVFDTVGGETFEKSFRVLKKGGIIVSMVSNDEKKLADQYGVKAISQFTKINTDNLNALTKFIEDKVVKVYVDKIYPLDRIKEAFEEKEKGDVRGKIAVKIQN